VVATLRGMSLPKQRDPARPYRISLVCLGNICRSPRAEKLVAAELERAGLSDLVEVDSSGTVDWHVGDDMDPRAASTLRVHGYPTLHTARQFHPDDLADRDLILVMALVNFDVLLRDVDEHGPHNEIAVSHVRLYSSFAPGSTNNPEVPYPYSGGDDGFTAVLNMVAPAAKGLT